MRDAEGDQALVKRDAHLVNLLLDGVERWRVPIQRSRLAVAGIDLCRSAGVDRVSSVSLESSRCEESNWMPWSAARAGDATIAASTTATRTAVRGLRLLTRSSLPAGGQAVLHP